MNRSDLSSLDYGLALFAVLIGGYVLGLLARGLLPRHHRTHESLEIVHAIIGMLVAMIAILLGLQLDSGKRSFDSVAEQVDRYGIELVQLDMLLRDYGPEAAAARAQLLAYSQAAAVALERQEPVENADQGKQLRQLTGTVRQLAPTSPMQTRMQAESLTLVASIARDRWTLIAKSQLRPDVPLYAILVFWIFVVYVMFGLNAAFNAPAFAALVVSAFAVSAAVFVLNDMETPFDGLIAISPKSLLEAVRRLQQ